MSNKRGRNEIENSYQGERKKRGIEELLGTDSFTSIVNSLSCDNNKCLSYETDKVVFQFPKNKIYVRDIYITTYIKIWDFIHNNLGKSPPPNIILLGQPGIGKTSFIYYLLFMLRNVISTVKDEDKSDTKSENDENEMNGIISCLNDILICKKKKEILEKREKILDMKLTKIEIFKKAITNIDVDSIITNEFNNLKSIVQEYNNTCKDEELKIKEEGEYQQQDWFVKHKVNRILEEANKYRINIEELTKKVSYYYSQLVNFEKTIKSNSNIRRTKTKINKLADEIYDNIIKLNNEYIKQKNYEKCKREFEINNNQDELKIEKDKISKELKEITIGLELKKKEFDEKYYDKSYNFISLNEKIKEILAEKPLYVVKAVNGNNTERVYEFSDDKLYLSNIKTDEINDSIVITDTYGDIDISNIVISISSPDHKNFENYEGLEGHKTIYFDSFDDEEMKEWYLNCIDDTKPTDFESVCEMYGNVTRQVFFHYLYKNNYHKNYWEYYKELINSVVGSIGFDSFISTYIPENKLKDNPLSNIIMKYDLHYNAEYELEPKESLIFVSSKIGMYVSSMLFPPKKIDEYIKILEYYTFNNNSVNNNNSIIHDECIDKMLVKQIGAYRIALGDITIKNSEEVLVKRNSSSFCYFPFNAIEEVTYILDEDDIFDFVVNGIFIKILYKNEDKLKFNRFINSNSNRLSEIKEKYIESENDINYLTINEYEIIGSIIDKTVVSNTNTPSIPDKYSEIKELDFYKEIKEMVKNNPNDFLKVLEIIKDKSTEQYQFVLDNLEEFALLLKEENKLYYYNTLNSSTIVNIIANNTTIVSTIKLENDNRFSINETFYIYRKCYEEIIYIIERNIINEVNQKNYLIFGNADIGKTVLAEYLYYYFINKYNKDYNILLIEKENDYYYCEKYETDSYYKEKLTPTPPYIVISDEIVIGEDEYSDASMVIVIGNSSDENIKTFQSKRFPLIMYIPPFPESEINSLEIEDDEKEVIRRYGGIVGYYYKDENVLIERIKYKIKSNKKFIKDMLNGETKSPLTKNYCSIIFTYNTYENDVTKSTRLQFISDEMKEICKEIYFHSYLNNNYDEMIKIMEEEPNGELGGIILERLILYLCENSKDFKDLLLENYDFKHNFILKLIKIKSDDNLKEEINNIKSKLKENIIPIFDLSYNPYFPDIDILFCFIGIKITVGLTHSLSADIIDMLKNLKAEIKKELIEEYIVLPDHLNDLLNNDLQYMIISNNRKVNLKYREVKEESKFPPVLLKYKRTTTKTEEEKKKEISILNAQKDLIYISFDEVKNMVNKIRSNNRL